MKNAIFQIMIKNIFDISDLSYHEFFKILNYKDSKNSLIDKNIGLIFEKHSTRTRLSFNVAISNLGGNSIDVKFEELNISRDESFEDTFRAMNCYLDGLVYRTSDHQKLIKASKYFDQPIINALSDRSHPCQIISDLFTLKDHFGTLTCNILWIGDMNNVCFSLVEAANIIQELNLIICTPAFVSDKLNWSFGSNTSIVHSLDEVDLYCVNCVMTDVYISMNDEEDEKKNKSFDVL